MVLLGGVEDRHLPSCLIPFGKMPGYPPFHPRNQVVSDAGVGEGAAHHDFMVAATRTVGIEILRLNAERDEITPGRRILPNRSGGRYVVGGYGISQKGQDAGFLDVCQRLGPGRQTDEKGRLLDVGGIFLPLVKLPGRHVELVPLLVSAKDVGIVGGEGIGVNAALHQPRDFPIIRPDVFQVYRLPVRVGAYRVAAQVDVYVAGQRVGDHQGRRGEIVGPDMAVDAPLEIAVAGEYCGYRQFAFYDGLGDMIGERAAVADAGGASVPYQVEAQGIQVGGEPGGGKVIGDHLGAGSKARLHPRPYLQPAQHGVSCQ